MGSFTRRIMVVDDERIIAALLMQVLQSATQVAAQCLGLNYLGTLEPGKWADVLVLDRNPLENIDNTRSLSAVWIAGNPVPPAP